MTRGEFEREMEQYIAQRRRAKIRLPDFFSMFKRKEKMSEPELPPEIQKYEEGSPAEMPETIPGEEEHKPEKSVIAKILELVGLVGGKKTADQLSQEQIQQMLAKDELSKDMKEIAKIALHITKQLPEEKLAEFKSSPEFERLKELLRKHQLIK